jgi:NADPH-dependent 2,4-dienoyl-CoA reductase/sulfur reductase-like enzyme
VVIGAGYIGVEAADALRRNAGAIEPGRVADVACDLVVVSAGFKPNVEIAVEAGVEVGRTGAIRADDRMETNLHGIYAAGDCAETMHLVTGRPTWIPLGTTANKTGRVAGANAAGSRERFAGVVGTSIVGIFGMGFATTGLSVEQARAPKVFRRWPRASKPRCGRATFRAPRPWWSWWPTAPPAD